MLAEALGITGDELLGVKPHESSTEASGDDEIALLRDYRLLNDQGKEWIRQSMTMAMQAYKKDHNLSDMEASKEIV